LDKMLCREINETIKNKQSGGAGSNQKPADDTDEAEKAKKAEAEAKKAEQEKAKKEAQEAEEKKKKEAEEKKQAENAKSDPLGFEIDKELEKAIKDGKTVVKLSELRSIAPNTYEAIFSGYEAGKENGVQTTFYSCIETETETFTIKKL
jgi:membrane protein involved in colicin uptake